MKLKTKILIVIMIALFAVLIGASNVKAAEEIASISVVDKNGNEMTYMPPESGGPAALLNTDKDYTNCNYIMYVDNNYGEKIETDFGTFTKEKTQNGYIYICPVKASDITSQKSGIYDLTFNATNVDTQEKDTITATFIFYKLGFKSNANLKVGETYIIKNGKVVKEEIDSAYYHEHSNTLILRNSVDNIYYSNMGTTFNIESFGDISYTITNEDTDTGIKLDSANSNLPKTVEVVTNKVTDGKMYDTVTTTLKDTVTKFYAYDISLSNAGVNFQPNGKVKISIKVPTDIDESKLVIYRVTEKGEKTEYKATIEIIDGEKYATFETDHFSTYVLAEKKAETKPSTNNQQQTTPPATTETPNKPTTNKGEKDNTPKTGTIDVIKYIIPVAVISACGIIALRRKETK